MFDWREVYKGLDLAILDFLIPKTETTFQPIFNYVSKIWPDMKPEELKHVLWSISIDDSNVVPNSPIQKPVYSVRCLGEKFYQITPEGKRYYKSIINDSLSIDSPLESDS